MSSKMFLISKIFSILAFLSILLAVFVQGRTVTNAKVSKVNWKYAFPIFFRVSFLRTFSNFFSISAGHATTSLDTDFGSNQLLKIHDCEFHPGTQSPIGVFIVLKQITKEEKSERTKISRVCLLFVLFKSGLLPLWTVWKLLIISDKLISG